METSEEMKEDPAMCLPWDMVNKIVVLLPDKDLGAMECCSRQWRKICGSDERWYLRCRRRWPTLFSSADPPSTKEWKVFYTRRHKEMKSIAWLHQISRLSRKELASSHFSFQDVNLFLFHSEYKPKEEYIKKGMFYCEQQLKIPRKRLVRHLRECNLPVILPTRKKFIRWRNSHTMCGKKYR